MKKNVFTLGLIAVAALTLATNCVKSEANLQTKEETPSVQGTFELFANSDDNAITKTNNDGMSTKWTASDQLSVFHAETTTDSYVKDGYFSTTADDKDAGLFKGTLASALESGKSYDWYVVYPYKSDLTTPANTTISYNVGGRNDKPTTQDGNDSKAHLDGSYFPLFGKTTGVAYDAKPAVTMNQLASVVEVKVTNKNDAPLTVDFVTFTAPEGEDITGQFKIDFTTSPVTYTSSSSVSGTAMLEVSGGSAIAKNSSASFFIGIKPFTAASGKTLKVSVNGHEKSLLLESDATFEAGKIKTLNFNYTYDPDVFELVTDLAAISDGGKYVFALQDGVTTSTYYFLNNAGTSNNLDNGLTVSTNTITNPSHKYVFTAEAASTLFKFKNSVGNYIANSSSSNLHTNNATGDSWLPSTLDGGYFKFNISTVSGKFMGAKAATPTAAGAYVNSNFKNQHADPASAIAQFSGAWSVFKLGGYTPPAGISNETVNDIAARGAAGLTTTVTLTGYGSAPTLTATPDGTVITAASVTATTTTSATITYTIANNYTKAARAGSITVTDTDSHSGTITINQVADVFSTTASNPLVIGQASGANKACTIKSDFDWTIDDSNLTGATVSPTSFTYTSSQSQSITFTTTAANAETTPANLGYIVVTRAGDGATLTINLQQQGVSVGETLPFNWDGGKADATANMTITAGSNYSTAPKVKFDTEGTSKIVVRIASAASQISFLVKQNGTATDSEITLAGSADGSTYTDIEAFTINIGSGTSHTFTSSASINSSYRYLRLLFTHKTSGTNLGVGTIHIE